MSNSITLSERDSGNLQKLLNDLQYYQEKYGNHQINAIIYSKNRRIQPASAGSEVIWILGKCLNECNPSKILVKS